MEAFADRRLLLCLTTVRAPPPMLRDICSFARANVYPWRDMYRPSPESVGYRRGGCMVTRVCSDIAFVALQDAGGNTNWAVTRHQLPPLWVDKVDAVEEDVRLIQLKSKPHNTIVSWAVVAAGVSSAFAVGGHSFCIHDQATTVGWRSNSLVQAPGALNLLSRNTDDSLCRP